MRLTLSNMSEKSIEAVIRVQILLQHIPNTCGYLLGKGSPLGSLLCNVFLCFCHFPIWCHGVVLNFIIYL